MEKNKQTLEQRIDSQIDILVEDIDMVDMVKGAILSIAEQAIEIGKEEKGKDFIDTLEKKALTNHSFTIPELQELIKDLNKKIRELESM